MKKILIVLLLVGLCSSANAEFLGIKQASETISFFLKKPLDSLYGIPRSPDSVHLFTYADNATAATFQTRSTTFPFSDISIDTLKHFTDTMFVLVDQIQDIDGAGGNFVLAIEVQMYYDEIPTTTHATVQIVSDSLENFLDATKDSSSSAAILSKNNLDSLQAQDGWVSHQSTIDSVLDSTQVAIFRITDSVLLANREEIASEISDSTWDKALTGATFNNPTTAGKRLRALLDPIGGGSAQVSATPTDPGRYIILAAAESKADDYYNGAMVHVVSGAAIGQARLIEDYTGATDSATLHTGDDWRTDVANNDGYEIVAWAAQEVVHIHGDALSSIGDTVWSPARDASLNTLEISPSAGNTNALTLTGAGTGHGLHSIGGSSEGGNGAVFDGGSSGGAAVTMQSQSGNYSGLEVYSTGNIGGIYAEGTGTGPGLEVVGGGSDGDIFLSSVGTISDGTNTAFMTNDVLAAANIGADAITEAKIADDAIRAEHIQANAIGSSELADAAINSSVLASGAIASGNIAAGAISSAKIGAGAIHSTAIAADAIGVGDIETDAINADALAADAVHEIWDRVVTVGAVEASGSNSTTQVQTSLAEATNDHYNTMAVLFFDGTEAGQMRLIDDYVGATGIISWVNALTGIPATDDSFYVMPWTTVSATVSNANMGAIADSVWDKAKADMVAESEGAGDFLRDSLEAILDTLNNLATLSEMADSVWKADFENYDGVAGSFGDSAQGWGATSASATDTTNIKLMINNNITSASGGDGWANTYADSVWDPTRDASLNSLDISPSAGNTNALTLTGAGTGHGLLSTSGSGATGNGIQATAASTNGNGIGLVATGSGVEITGDDLVDLIWNESWAAAYTAGSIGDSLSTAAYVQGTASGLTADVIWGHDLSTYGVFDDSGTIAGAFLHQAGDSVGWPSLGEMADSVWLKDTNDVSGRATAIGILMDAKISTAGGSGSDTTAIKLMMNNNWTSASGGDGWANMIRDSVWDAAVDAALKSLTISGANGANGSFYVTNSTGPGVKYTSTYNNSAGDAFIVTSDWSDAVRYTANAGQGFAIGAAAGVVITATAGNGIAVAGAGGGNSDISLGGTGTISDGTNDVFMTNDVLGTDALTSTSLATSAVDEIWEYDSANISGAQAMGTLLKDTSAYQGAAGGITVDQIWEYDTANISGADAVGTMLKDTVVYQGAAAGITVDAIWEYDSANVSGAAAMGRLVKDITDTVNANNAYFDTLIYQHGVWVDAGANTNTVVGVDGTPKNPVGTIAAAKTIADALGFATIYFLDGASETIGETMEHYRFVGITRSATVNLGGQDVDGSFFECLTITGEQGGSGLIVVCDAGLTNVDNMEVHARNCAILGSLSLRAGDNYFDKCYSSVAGNATPVLDFADVGTTVNVSWRAYSGGLEIQNMTTDHTMSYESDGQLVINANCDNGSISARGMMTITDNGMSMNITKDAVFSRAEADLWVWANADTSGSVDTSDVGVWLANNTGLGGGDNRMWFYAIDTSGTDDTLSGVSVTVYNSTGALVGSPQTTPSAGDVQFGVPTGDIQLVASLGAGYTFPDTVVTTSNNDTVGIVGWSTTIASPGNPSYATVHASVWDASGNKLTGAIMHSVRVVGGNAADTAASIVVPTWIPDTRSDTGYVSQTLMRTGSFSEDTTKGFYDILITYDGEEVLKIKQLYIPASGNVALDSVIAVRPE